MSANDSASVICTAWKPFERNTLRGFADLWLRAARLNIRGCAVHEKSGRRWVQLPAKPQLDKDRNLVRDEDGKIQYAKVIDFDSREVADRFNAKKQIIRIAGAIRRQRDPARLNRMKEKTSCP